MSSSGLAPKQSAPRFSVALANGRTLICPQSLEHCTWVAVLLDGAEVYRATAEALAADPSAELTRLAEALIPGREPTRPPRRPHARTQKSPRG